jgi:hypothetical protein
MGVKKVGAAIGVGRPLERIEPAANDGRVRRQGTVTGMGLFARGDETTGRIVSGQGGQNLVQRQEKDVLPEPRQSPGAQRKGAEHTERPHRLRADSFARLGGNGQAVQLLPVDPGLARRHSGFQALPRGLVTPALLGQHRRHVDLVVFELGQAPVEPLRVLRRAGNRELDLVRAAMAIQPQILLAAHLASTDGKEAHQQTQAGQWIAALYGVQDRALYGVQDRAGTDT